MHARSSARGATTLRLAVDSRPLTGARRVEDTFSLIAQAARPRSPDTRLLRSKCTSSTRSDQRLAAAARGEGFTVL